MTLPATTRRAGPFEGNDATTTFPFTFKVFATDELVVYLTSTTGVETVLTLDSDYSVTLNGDQTADPGGDITYPLSGDPLATGELLTAIGGLPYDQTLDIPDGGNFDPLAMENALDRIEMQIQQLAETMTRALILPVSADDQSFELPAGVPFDLIGWDEDGLTLVNYTPGAGATTVVNQYLANQSVLPVALTAGATVNVDASLSNSFTLTPNQNFTLAAPTNATDGMVCNFVFTQGGTPYTITFNAAWQFAGGTEPTLTASASAVDFMSCYYNGATSKWICVMNKDFKA
jgi:hypothetical protein